MRRLFQQAVPGLVMVLLSVAGAWAESSVWVVKGAKATVYLSGSCHVLRASDHPLPAEFETAYAQSRQIIFEAPPGDLKTMEYMKKLMVIAGYKDGTTIKQHLRPAVYTKVEKFCKERNHPFEQYQLFRPWMLSMMLAMREMERIGVEADYGIDHFFYQKAIKDGKAIGGLETADEQLGFLNLMDAGMGNENVSETIDDLLQLDSKITDILKTWRTGDEVGIEAFNLRELKNYPRLYSALIIERNKKWVKKIEGLINGNQNAMVIVGAAHLAGTNSVVDLLRKRGCVVAKL